MNGDATREKDKSKNLNRILDSSTISDVENLKIPGYK